MIHSVANILAFLAICGFAFCPILPYKHERTAYSCEPYKQIIRLNLDFIDSELLDIDFICTIMYYESRFKPDAISRANAKGLMQIKNIVLLELFLDTGAYGINLMRPIHNITVGMWYLNKLVRYTPPRCLETLEETFHFVLSAYNHGVGKALGYTTCKTDYSIMVFKKYKKKIK